MIDTLGAPVRRRLGGRPSIRQPGDGRKAARLPPTYGARYITTLRSEPTLDQATCSNSFVTRSTTPVIHVEICARCHPYFTGKQKLVDTAGRVERFRQKYGGDKPAG